MKKSDIKKLDACSRERCKEEYGDRCVICGQSGNINIHHYIGRRMRSCRWYIPNLVPLCPKHHTLGLWSAHQNPEYFRIAMIDRRGKQWLEDLTNQSNKTFKGTYEDVLAYLKGEKDNYC